MGKAIQKIKIISFILIVIELLIIIAFSILYFVNFPFLPLQEIIDPLFVIVAAIGLVFVNIIFIWITVLRIARLRQKTDLHAAEVIGSDVQEAYNFAMIGLAVTNEEDVVLWTNDLFKDRHIDIIDSNILTWHEDLFPLKESGNPDTTVKIIINSRNYEVKYIKDAGLWIFKDITDYESIYAYSREQAPVVGIIALDNYEDVVKGDDDFNDVVSKVKNVIFTYAKEYGILLRRVKEDNYAMLCNFDSFSKMKEDKFSIIDKVRDVSFGEDIPLTLSIGIAHDFPDVIKLNELALDALDIAISRGGDQVVVSVYGSEMEFYGGKSEAQEKRNRVKTRVLADSLISLFKNTNNVLVMGHVNMDMDALGACLGIKAICDRLEKECKVITDLKLTEIKTRNAITSSFVKSDIEQIFVSPKEANSLVHSDTLLVVVDVHIPSMTMYPDILNVCSKVVVIDHHRRAEDYIVNPVFNHIDAAASSTCELIAEFIKYSTINPIIEIPSIYATIMLSGIFLDSSNFKSRSTGLRTFEACTILKEFGADNAMADDFLKDDYEEHKIVTNILSNLEHPYYGLAIAVANEELVLDNATIAKAANVCLSFKGIRTCFVIGKISNKEVRISGRSDGSVNVSLLLEKMGGGGHFTSAAANVITSDINTAKEQLLNVLERYLKDAKNQDKRKEEDD